MSARVRKTPVLLDGIAWATLATCCAAALVGAADAPKAARPASRPAMAPVDPDLYGWWRATDGGKDGVTDASGHAHGAKPLARKVETETVGGRAGFRIRSDGAGVLSAGADAGFDFSGDFSVALRVKLSGPQSDVALLSKRGEGGADGWVIAHGIRGVGGFGFVAAPRVVVPTPIKAADDWVHVAVTFRQKDFSLYVDGKAIGVMELPHVPTPSKQPLLIGAGAGGKAAMDGWVDDVRVYHRGLTEAEVEALAAGREPPSPYAKMSAAQTKAVRDLVRELGSDSFAARERAAAKLKGMGRAVFPLLKELREGEDGEVVLRINGILGELPAGGGGGDDAAGERE